MEKKVIVRKPKWLRRIASSFLDLLIAILLGLILSFATDPIGNALFHGKESKETYYSYVTSTHLYIVNSNNELEKISDLNTYDENLTYFYLNCTDNKIQEYYNAKKENKELFTYDELTNTYSEIPYDKDNPDEANKYMKFYMTVRDDCIEKYVDDYLHQFEDFLNSANNLFVIDYFSLVVSSLLALLIVYLLIPLVQKENKTIGKLAFKLKVVSKNNPELKVSKLQILFRQLVLILFEYALTISTIGIFHIPLPIVLIVSIIMVIFTKYNQSFHDLCTQTFIIDDYPYNEAMNANEKYELIFKGIKVNE